MVSLQFSSSASPCLTFWWSSLLILYPWFRFGNGQFAVLILCLTLADLLVVFCGVLGALILEVNHFFFFFWGGGGMAAEVPCSLGISKESTETGRQWQKRSFFFSELH
jgi:hypothetical protein